MWYIDEIYRWELRCKENHSINDISVLVINIKNNQDNGPITKALDNIIGVE